MNRRHFDHQDHRFLRTRTAALCQEIEYLIRRLETGAPFKDIEKTFRADTQPVAYGLAEAILHHVPDDDPRFMVRRHIGQTKEMVSDDLTLIDQQLNSQTALTHLKDIVNKLQALTGYLPN